MDRSHPEWREGTGGSQADEGADTAVRNAGG